MTKIRLSPYTRGMYKVEFEDLGTKVYKALKNMIISGELKPGEKLVQEELAERLGVSRTPLLSAFAKLAQENLVETISRRGAYVKKFSEQELVDIYDIRIQLEPLGAERAATFIEPDGISQLEQLLKEYDVATQAKDMNALKQIDYQFHMTIMKNSQNRLLYDMLSTFNVIIISNIKGLLKPPEKSDTEHHRLLEALKSKNPEEARRIMYEHILDSRSNLLKHLIPFNSQ
ncbi:MAG: GntR family transcriptional regulator [Spirochaetales bacterium]